MGTFKMIACSDNKTEKERKDGKPSRQFVTAQFGSLDAFDQRTFTRNIWLERHNNNDELVAMKNDGDTFRKMVGKTLNAEVFTIKGSFDVNGRQVDHSTAFLFAHECADEATTEVNLRRLAPKAWVEDSAIIDAVEAEEPATTGLRA